MSSGFDYIFFCLLPDKAVTIITMGVAGMLIYMYRKRKREDTKV